MPWPNYIPWSRGGMPPGDVGPAENTERGWFGSSVRGRDGTDVRTQLYFIAVSTVPYIRQLAL